MKKVLIATDLRPVIMQGESFLNRTDIAVFTAKSNDDMPGHRSKVTFDISRQSKNLREVLMIVLCEDNVTNRERCARCGAGAMLTLPNLPQRSGSSSISRQDNTIGFFSTYSSAL